MLLLSSVSKLPHEPELWAESLPSADLSHTKNRTGRLIQITEVRTKSKNETDSIIKRLKIQSHELRQNRIALFLVTWLTSGHRRDRRHLNLTTITGVSFLVYLSSEINISSYFYCGTSGSPRYIHANIRSVTRLNWERGRASRFGCVRLFHKPFRGFQWNKFWLEFMTDSFRTR